MSTKELGRVLDYTVEEISRMTEDQLIRLTDSESFPGKIIYSSLFCITTLSTSMPLLDAPCLKKRPPPSQMQQSILGGK